MDIDQAGGVLRRLLVRVEESWRKCVHLIVRRNEYAAIGDDGRHELLNRRHGVGSSSASIDTRARICVQAVQLVVIPDDPHQGIRTLRIGHANGW